MKKKLFSLLVTVIALFTLLCGTVSAEERDSISVNGHASAEVSPDMATLYGSLEKSAPTAEEAREKLAREINVLKRTLLTQMIAEADIKTTGYSVQPNYSYDTKGIAKLVNYTAQAEYRIAVKNLDNLSSVLDNSIKANLKVNQVEYGLKNRALVENGLLDDAVANARSQAAVVARAGGRTLGALIRADLGTVNGAEPRPIPYMLRSKSSAMGDSDGTPTQLNPGVLTVNVNVGLVFALQ